jgi:23S rRNA (cytosine1962-C5)-methyltransferase
MSSELPQIRLKIERRSNHPWVFQKMVEKPATRVPPGSVVDVLDRGGAFAERGFYCSFLGHRLPLL